MRSIAQLRSASDATARAWTAAAHASEFGETGSAAPPPVVLTRVTGLAPGLGGQANGAYRVRRVRGANHDPIGDEFIVYPRILPTAAGATYRVIDLTSAAIEYYPRLAVSDLLPAFRMDYGGAGRWFALDPTAIRCGQ